MADITPTPTTPVNLATPPPTRMSLKQQSLPSLQVIQGKILEESRKELLFPQSVKTYDKMLLETNVASAIKMFEMMLSRVAWSVVVPKKAPEEETKRAELLNRNLSDLERPFEEYINEIVSILQYGFCPLEKLYEVKTYKGTKFKGWKHFPVISQNSIDKWYFDSNTGLLKGLRQDVSGLKDTYLGSNGITKTTEDIGKHKFILFRHNPKKDSPEGLSPLRSVWLTWKYLSVVEEYEAIGVAKDLGGVMKVGFPEEIMAAAYADENSWQASLIETTKKQVAAITAGDQTSIIHTNKFDERGNSLYTLELLGANGGGTTKDTDAIATRHANKILMAFFADVLKLGTDGSGSFALADSKTSTLAMAIESILSSIKRTLDHDLIKQTYAINGWEYDPATSARFEFSDLEEEDLGVWSSAVQRVMAVGAARTTSDIEDAVRGKVFNLEPFAEASPTIIETANDSKVGQGMKDGLGNGTGKSTSKGGDRSKSNTSNVEEVDIK